MPGVKFGQMAQNSEETVRFHKIYKRGNYVKFRYFTQCYFKSLKYDIFGLVGFIIDIYVSLFLEKFP